ncbi:unnamed protein product [Adineta ricciae]|uniref:Poly [ADP-ribose] polymerase n=1 Tax=Adineta ricciae TaxID=249248 RepID=A0A815I172_ADIRI|nr:unnamed protein product [Adineta ricciae]
MAGTPDNELLSSTSDQEETSMSNSRPVYSPRRINQDIRLCTITRTHEKDTYGIEITSCPIELFYSIRILPSGNKKLSNAALAGVKPNDRIVEINDESVDLRTLEEVVQLLQETKYPQPLILLVTNAETYDYYRHHDKQIHSKLPNVRKLSNRVEKRIVSSPLDGLRKTNSLMDLHLPKPTTTHRNIPRTSFNQIKSENSLVNVCKGDLATQNVDVIVVSSSSQFLFDSICQAGGTDFTNAYNAEVKKKPGRSLISIKADGKLTSKQVYFLPWTERFDHLMLSASIQKFVSDAITEAANDKFRSMAFPAIGCGLYGYSIDLVARTMTTEAYQQSLKHRINVSFVIQPQRMDVFETFRNQIDSIIPKQLFEVKSTTIKNGSIEVIKGDMTKQKVDVIIASSSSGFLLKTILNAAGADVSTAYNNELKNRPNAILIETPGGALFCKRIFFVKWEPNHDPQTLRISLTDMVSTVIQSAISHKFTSIAFPAIGCGNLGCSVNIVVETLVFEMKKCLLKRQLPWTVKFVIEPSQQNVYDEFWTQVSKKQDDLDQQCLYEIPSTWETSTDNKMRFELSPNTREFQEVKQKFNDAMHVLAKEIIRIERIQNERWYVQYLAHQKDFKSRLNNDTERRLFHGCPEQAANSIITDCFNRSHAGANATLYGVGAYFSSHATFSHSYANPNSNGERRMFIARVLIGKTTPGDSSMKTRPVGFDSTTDGNHIFVIYHDAQAYAEYLITYK